MVLDAKVMGWATQQGLDTAALKKAKVPIYGKWYFPDLPANVPLVNLATGQVESFPPGYRAGAILYAKEEDLKRAGLGPYKAVAPPPAVAEAPAPAAVAEPAPVRAATAAPARPADAAPVTHAPRPETPAHPIARSQEPIAHPDPSRGPAAGSHPVEHPHPTPGKYIQIASILAVITAVEVALYYVPGIPSPVLFWTLMALSALKFYFVAAFFMHLKFDHTSFAAYFAGGMALAIATFLGVLAMHYGRLGPPTGF